MTYRHPFCVINPQEHYGERVGIYVNSHHNVFSIRAATGLVKCHSLLCAVSDVDFKVSPRGRQEAIATGMKNVHAFVVGELRYMGWEEVGQEQIDYLIAQGFRRVGYDLRQGHEEFYLKDEAKYYPIKQASAVILASGKAWAKV